MIRNYFLFFIFFSSSLYSKAIVTDDIIGFDPVGNEQQESCYFYENDQMYLYSLEREIILKISSDNENRIMRVYPECPENFNPFVVIDDFLGF